MQRAERDLARARLAATGGDPDAGPAFAAAISGLRQHSTPYHLAHGLLDHAAHLSHCGDDQAAAAAASEAADIAQPGSAASHWPTAREPSSRPSTAPRPHDDRTEPTTAAHCRDLGR